jgi:hypothetical protein
VELLALFFRFLLLVDDVLSDQEVHGDAFHDIEEVKVFEIVVGRHVQLYYKVVLLFFVLSKALVPAERLRKGKHEVGELLDRDHPCAFRIEI